MPMKKLYNLRSTVRKQESSSEEEDFQETQVMSEQDDGKIVPAEQFNQNMSQILMLLNTMQNSMEELKTSNTCNQLEIQQLRSQR